MSSPTHLARIAGILYLILAILGGFAHFYARGTVYVPGDAAATADRAAANATLVRVGVVADLVQATLFLFLAMALYLLLQHVGKNVARAMMIIVAVAVAMICLNMVHQFAALLIATDASYPAALGTGGADALVLLMLDLHSYGYLTAQIFFGLWLLPLGYLAYRSGMFPRLLGVFLMIGCFGYLIDTFAHLLLPDVSGALASFVVAPAGIAEFWMIGWLLVKGVKAPRPAPRVATAASQG